MSRISSTDVGSIKVTSLLDGELVLPAEVLINLKDEDAETIKANAENTLSYTNVNTYLIQKGDRNLLVVQELESFLAQPVVSSKKN